ncbi:Flap-structured DNA-binding and RNA-binding protein [Spiromyces aspiralis]|uniref:Flap-structured DNA-binding and RNA-binding protein n=1 Tax=Spiromyces aspiralis TaxID=68401 RepID=A0ACC1HMJ5_9FUNG|nr:Flap-structured DNA-binding and RNA-binding protein [Spiromyces aspiralis]
MVGASGGGAWPPTAPMTVNSGGNVAGLRSKSIGSAITIGGHAGAHIPSQSKVSTVHLHHQPQSFSAVVTQKQQQQQQQQQQSSPAPPQLPQQPQQGRRSSQPTSSNGTSMQSRHQLPSHPHPPRASRPQSPVPANSTGGSANGQVAPKPQDIVDFDLLKDIPAWLRTLRLHKYTPCFETMKWTDIIELTDEDLTNKGVSALGARRKMLKVFENIKNEIEERKMQGIAVPIP